MPTSKTSPYDVLIVGAGINGCCCAYVLRQAGLRVALIDRSGIAAGGSGAAGAFISPKFSKGGPLKEIMSLAHAEALDFYPRNFPSYTLQHPLLHISNSSAESEKLAAYKRSTDLDQRDLPDSVRESLRPDALENEWIYLEQGAVVDAQGVCRAMAEGIDVYRIDVQSPEYSEGHWRIEGLSTPRLILTTGAYPKVLASDSVKLRAIWGHRIDVATTTEVPCILHHFVSISPTLEAGSVAIGATHDVHYDPFSQEPYDYESGRAILLERASKTITLNDIKVLRDYTGLRSGTHDYYPIAGRLVDEAATLRSHEKENAPGDPQECIEYPEVWMVNGSGGYGFVLAPYLAKKVCEWIMTDAPGDPALSPGRFWRRQVRRQS